MPKNIFLFLFFASISLEIFGQIEAPSNNDIVKGELLIKLEKGIDIDLFLERFNQQNASYLKLKKRISNNLSIYLVTSDWSFNEQEELDKLNQDIAVEMAQYNHRNIVIRGNIPNDPNYANQWAAQRLGLEEAWQITTGGENALGDTIVIAVIDGGIYKSHIDLDIFVNHNEIPDNNIDDDGNGYIDDVSGWNAFNDNGIVGNDFHGTMVAGVLGAIGNNNTGIAGVNWKVKILPIEGSTGVESVVLKAYDYVLTMRKMYNQSNGEKGAYIVAANSSFGVNRKNENDFPLWCAFYDSLGAEGVLSIGATANARVNVDEVGDIPTNCTSPFLIGVSSSDKDDKLTFNAAFGEKSIDIVAPGEEIYSTSLFNNYNFDSGTSFAAPYVSGLVGLIHSVLCDSLYQVYADKPDSLALLIKDIILLEGVRKLPEFEGITKSGGILDIGKAINFVNKCNLLGLSNNENTVNKDDLLIYPNPAHHLLHIETQEKIQYFSIFNLHGQAVKDGQLNNQKSIDISDLTSGFYLIQLSLRSDNVVLKFLKI